jgi:ubiquitin
MASKPKGKKKAAKKAGKPVAIQTDDDIMDRIVGKEARERLKKLARDSRKKN